MDWVTVIDNGNDMLSFNLAKKETVVGVVIYHERGQYFWTMCAEVSGKTDNFYLKENQFIQTDPKKVFSEIELEVINKGFCALFKRMKENTTYRLKVMHMLNDQIREVWDKL